MCYGLGCPYERYDGECMYDGYVTCPHEIEQEENDEEEDDE